MKQLTKYNNEAIVIMGGGTFEPIRNHLSLAAPAFGTTARILHNLIPESYLILTKMADSNSSIISNNDVSLLIDELLRYDSIKSIILNIAFCDYKVSDGDFHGERLETSKGDITISMTPTEKIIDRIRRVRPDIFLVGFKTTTNKTTEEQFSIGLKMMKRSKCNLVLANDTVTRNNIIITPEESYYGDTTDREKALKELIEIHNSRIRGTYNRTNLIVSENIPIQNCLGIFQKTISFLIQNGGFICNNGNGFTPGHFCQRVNKNSFVSSQRKANHNLVFDEGLSLVEVNDDVFTVYGCRKASVGARSQWMILNSEPEYDCIIHTHNPLKVGSKIPIAQQKPFQCGSLECGINTASNLVQMEDGIKAVYLEKHGANIVFKSTTPLEKVIQFIQQNIELGVKTT